MNHELKIHKRYYDRIRSGQKLFEIRKNDRDYQVGDTISFIVITGERVISQMVFGPAGPRQITTNSEGVYKITYVHHGYGMGDNFVALSMEEVDR